MDDDELHVDVMYKCIVFVFETVPICVQPGVISCFDAPYSRIISWCTLNDSPQKLLRFVIMTFCVDR